eukprot:354903-Chlamydomonas_euryale.AAC.42
MEGWHALCPGGEMGLATFAPNADLPTCWDRPGIGERQGLRRVALPLCQRSECRLIPSMPATLSGPLPVTPSVTPAALKTCISQRVPASCNSDAVTLRLCTAHGHVFTADRTHWRSRTFRWRCGWIRERQRCLVAEGKVL